MIVNHSTIVTVIVDAKLIYISTNQGLKIALPKNDILCIANKKVFLKSNPLIELCFTESELDIIFNSLIIANRFQKPGVFVSGNIIIDLQILPLTEFKRFNNY